jgi:hypothetical protein
VYGAAADESGPQSGMTRKPAPIGCVIRCRNFTPEPSPTSHQLNNHRNKFKRSFKNLRMRSAAMYD